MPHDGNPWSLPTSSGAASSSAQDDQSYILRKLGSSLGKFTPLVTDRDLTVRVVEQGLDTRATAAATL